MLPDSRNAGAPDTSAEGEANDQLPGGSSSSVEPNPAAVARISRALALAVWTHNGHRALTRTYHTTVAAQRAAERAQERGDAVVVVLVRLTPVLLTHDPLQLVLEADTA